VEVKPFGPIAGGFIQDNSEVAVIVGPVGSAKTTAACIRLARHAYEQRPGSDGVARSRWAIVRNTRRQLLDTTLKTWLKVFPENQYGEFQKTGMTHHWSFKPKGRDYAIDAEFVFRALDDEADVTNLLSAEYTGAWFNEVREINKEILTHMGRRVGRFPEGPTWFGWIGDSNAWDFEHHLHDWLLVQPREGYRLFKQPGGLEPDAENVANLPGGVDYYVRALRDYSPADADVYVHAKWGASRSGKPIYTDFNDSVHIRPVSLDPHAPLLIGYDFGRTPAAVIAQRSVIGQWLIAREFCGEDIGVDPHAAALKRFLATELPGFTVGKVTGDPSGRAKGAHDMDMFRIVQSRLGGVAIPALTNDPDTRIEAVNGTFRRLINGSPAILIDPRCKMLRAACISGYRYKKLRQAGNQYTDKPDKNEHSHVAEALQYLLLGGGEGRAAVAGGRAPMTDEQFSRACRTRREANWSPLDPFTPMHD
jgi:hypothetical protein